MKHVLKFNLTIAGVLAGVLCVDKLQPDRLSLSRPVGALLLPHAHAQCPPSDAARRFDLNQVTRPELVSLPGIGPAKADAILTYRTKVKTFRRLSQLLRVRGIGRKLFRKLRPHLYIESTKD